VSSHKIIWRQSGTHETFGDWDTEHVITFRYIPPQPARRDDPLAGPAVEAQVEFISVSPDAGDHGIFSDIAQRHLEDGAADWLTSDGYDEAVQIAVSDLEAAREAAADLRRDRMREADR
jgi:hypothetical protein